MVLPVGKDMFPCLAMLLLMDRISCSLSSKSPCPAALYEPRPQSLSIPHWCPQAATGALLSHSGIPLRTPSASRAIVPLLPAVPSRLCLVLCSLV